MTLCPEIRRILETCRHKINFDFMEGRFNKVSKGKVPKVRKLSSFPDKELKIRTIGILDYFSQIALKPLHNYLMSALKKIHQDCTFDQAHFRKLLLKGNVKTFYSVDLSAATDRFPITLICKVLEGRFTKNFVKAWKYTMVGIPFFSLKGPVSYQTGNPMGAYSSFTSFALSHHFIIYYCCRVHNKD